MLNDLFHSSGAQRVPVFTQFSEETNNVTDQWPPGIWGLGWSADPSQKITSKSHIPKVCPDRDYYWAGRRLYLGPWLCAENSLGLGNVTTQSKGIQRVKWTGWTYYPILDATTGVLRSFMARQTLACGYIRVHQGVKEYKKIKTLYIHYFSKWQIGLCFRAVFTILMASKLKSPSTDCWFNCTQLILAIWNLRRVICTPGSVQYQM